MWRSIFAIGVEPPQVMKPLQTCKWGTHNHIQEKGQGRRDDHFVVEKEGPEEVSRPHLLPGNFYEAWKRLHPRTSFPVEQPQWRIIFIGGKVGRVPGLCVRGFWKIRSKKLWEILWLGQFHAWMTPWRRHNGAIFGVPIFSDTNTWCCWPHRNLPG